MSQCERHASSYAVHRLHAWPGRAFCAGGTKVRKQRKKTAWTYYFFPLKKEKENKTILVKQLLSTGDSFCTLRGHWTMSGDMFSCHNLRRDIKWVQKREDAQHQTAHSSFHGKGYPAHIENRAKAEKSPGR